MRPIRAISGIWLAAFLASAFVTASASATSYGVMAWGARGNSSPGFKLGQLGNGRDSGSSAPVAVSGLSEVTDVSGGLDYSLALLANGTVKSWGDNTFAELGTGSISGPESCETREVPCSRLPVAVSGLTAVRAISAGDGFGLALLENGKVMAWGENRYGQLGNGASTGPEHCEATGTVPGPCSATPTAVKGLGEVTQIAAGKGFALALLSSGKVMAWGNNAAGELGDGTTTAKSEPVEVQGLGGVLAISAGYNEGLALLSSGKVMAWGGNVHAQLGTGETSGPESCGGAPCSRTPVEVQGLSGVAEISAGYWNEIVRLSNGKVMTWGNNEYGELGIGNHTGPEYCPAASVACSATPVEVKGLGGTVASVSASEFSEVLARMSNGTAMSWGYNNEGQLGSGDEFGPETKCGQGLGFEACDSTPEPVVGLADAAKVFAGGYFGLAMVPSASPPEFGRCIKVETGTGKYDNAGCSKEGGEGKYEWYPGLEKTKFATTGGEATFEGAYGAVVHCKSESGEGAYSGQKTVAGMVMKLNECVEPLVGSCSTAWAASGEVVTHTLTGVLGVEETSGEGPSKNKIALSLSPAGGVLFEAGCGGSSVPVRGSVLVPVKANTMALTSKLKFKAKLGKQEPEEFEGGPKEVLEGSFYGHPFEQTGLTLTIEQANEEKVSISSIA